MDYHDELLKAQAELVEFRASFGLRWKADMRAIKRWQEAHPDRKHVWPDHADMCVWLMERIEKLEQALKSLRSEELEGEPGHWGIKCITDHNAIIDEALKP